MRQALREAYADPDDPEGDTAECQLEPESIALFQGIRAVLEERAARCQQGLQLVGRQLIVLDRPEVLALGSVFQEVTEEDLDPAVREGAAP